MFSLVNMLSTVNSFVRTLLALVVTGLIAAASWFGYTTFHAGELALQEKERALADVKAALDRAQQDVSEKAALLEEKDTEITQLQGDVSQLQRDVAAKERKIQQLDTAMRLLKIDHRLAEITVLNQDVDPETDQLHSTIQFGEINDRGERLEQPREFRLRGNLVYVDYWVVKFEDKYVEQADLDRATSICLFRRIFGEFQEPQDGYVLDEIGARPVIYARGKQMSDFEKKIWADFWEIANNPTAARGKGIRAAHGEAVSTQLRTGKTYRLLLRASGGLSITPSEETSADVEKPAA